MINVKTKVRNVDGVLLLDKPSGITSNDVLQMVKRIFRAKKAGHTGSLDPIATGMLVICFGTATKFASFLLEANKNYHATCKLGINTTTGDSEGEIIAQNTIQKITHARLIQVLQEFTGNIEQIPPMHSAIKYQGQPLYKLARRGITVKRAPRPITIYSLKVLNFDEDIVDLEITCSKGTYIRTLVEDIGNRLGCGAHVIALRRLAVEPYKNEDMVTLDELQTLSERNHSCSSFPHGSGNPDDRTLKNSLDPRVRGDDERTVTSEPQKAIDSALFQVESIVEALPEVRLTETAEYYLRRGQPVMVPNAPSKGTIRLRSKDAKFLGVGEILQDGKVAPKRLID